MNYKKKYTREKGEKNKLRVKYRREADKAIQYRDENFALLRVLSEMGAPVSEIRKRAKQIHN